MDNFKDSKFLIEYMKQGKHYRINKKSRINYKHNNYRVNIPYIIDRIIKQIFVKLSANQNQLENVKGVYEEILSQNGFYRLLPKCMNTQLEAFVVAAIYFVFSKTNMDFMPIEEACETVGVDPVIVKYILYELKDIYIYEPPSVIKFNMVEKPQIKTERDILKEELKREILGELNLI